MILRAVPNRDWFLRDVELPYQLRLSDFESALADLYDLLFDINRSLLDRGLRRLEETVRPAIVSGIISDVLAASVARHSRTLTTNRFHNGHPDLVPEGVYPHDATPSGHDGVEVKVTKGSGGVDMHGARPGWLCIFRYESDAVTEPVQDRHPTEVIEILLAKLDADDFRRNARGELGTRTASPNRVGLAKLRQNRLYRKPQ